MRERGKQAFNSKKQASERGDWMLEREEVKHSVPANKRRKEGIGCLREGKASSSNKQASERGELMLERGETKHPVQANKH